MEHGFDDVQTDSAAGNLGDLIGRAESWPEHQFENLRFAHLIRFFRRNQALRQCFGFDPSRIDAGTVITDFHHNLIALVIRSQMNGAPSPLSRADTFLGSLDTMANCIPNQMGQGLSDYV